LDKILSNLISLEENAYLTHFKTIQKEAVLTLQSNANTRLLMLLLNSYSDLPLSDPIFGLQE